jgi:membrane fusion protein, multidrug efflux system
LACPTPTARGPGVFQAMQDLDEHREHEADTAPRADAPTREEPKPRTDDRPRRDEGQRQGQGRADRGSDQKGGSARQKRKKGSPIPLIILAIFIVIAAIGGTWYWWSTRDLQSTDDAYTDGHAVTIAPRVSGQVTELAVRDNQFVHKGDLLIQIDPRDYQTARDQAAGNLAVAEGQLANAQYAAEVARATFPARLAAAQAQVQVAHANQFKAQTDYQRQHNIPRAATTQEAVDTSTAALQQANAQVAQAEANLREAQPVQPNISEVEANVKRLQGQIEQARAQLAQAELNLSYTRVVAPQDGWVTKRNVEMGNYVQPGQAILSLVSPDIWITANFKETELNRIRPGQHVDIEVDAYGRLHLEGHVDSVQMGSGAQFSAFPAENATGNFVKIVRRVPVKIDIDKGLDPKLPLPLGISVEPTVHLK